MSSIFSELNSRILVLDGAMGTMIQTYKLEEEDFRGDRFKDHEILLKGNNDLLSITRADIIKDIHKGYIDSGADIIQTNTFSSTSIAMEDYALQDLVYELNFESAKIAREVTDKFDNKKYVAGSIGPTNKTASMSPDVNDPGFRAITFDELVESYKEQIKGLVDGGSDILLVETVFDTLNAKAALMAINDFFEENNTSLPVMLSGTITDNSGRTLSGQTVNAFLISLSHFPLLSIGFNCALGADKLRPYLKRLSNSTNFFTSVYPNAGLPNAFGEYDQTPNGMLSQLREYLDENLVNIIGGCCGTTYDHIKLISEEVKKYKPRPISNE
ncbi:MAG: homocysteine S-methyltransferase family protein [Cytophagales bacterium]